MATRGRAASPSILVRRTEVVRPDSLEGRSPPRPGSDLTEVPQDRDRVDSATRLGTGRRNATQQRQSADGLRPRPMPDVWCSAPISLTRSRELPTLDDSSHRYSIAWTREGRTDRWCYFRNFGHALIRQIGGGGGLAAQECASSAQIAISVSSCGRESCQRLGARYFTALQPGL